MDLGKSNFERSILLGIALTDLAEKFPSPGEGEKKITINESVKIVREIASECDCKQYFEMSCALEISQLAKVAIEEVKPLFIKAVADGVMEKLARLSPEEQLNKFKAY